jgi:hypothetical protein
LKGAVPGEGDYAKTGLEEINGDLLEAVWTAALRREE